MTTAAYGRIDGSKSTLRLLGVGRMFFARFAPSCRTQFPPHPNTSAVRYRTIKMMIHLSGSTSRPKASRFASAAARSPRRSSSRWVG